MAKPQAQPQGTLTGLHQCQRAAVLEAAVGMSCHETLVLDMEGNMNTLRYTGKILMYGMHESVAVPRAPQQRDNRQP